MKQRRGLPTVAYVLAGILVLSVLMMFLTRASGTSEPSIGSFNPSGLRLFASVLRESGYKLDSTRDPTPRLDPSNDVAIAIFTDLDPLEVAQRESRLETSKALKQFAEKGGRLIQSGLARDFEGVTRMARQIELKSRYSGEVLPIFAAENSMEAPEWLQDEPTGTYLFETYAPWATLVEVGKGRGLHISDFSGATNRFIDREQNARAYLAAVRAVAPEGSRIVFVEAAWGNSSEPGIIESIGDWAYASWMQFVVLLLVVAYTLGKPFGLAEAFRPKQTGQRELVDAYGGLMERTGATTVALESLLQDADLRIRKALKMDRSIPKAERNAQLPPEMASLLESIEYAAALEPTSSQAVDLANRLDRAVSAFTGDRRQQGRRRMKS